MLAADGEYTVTKMSALGAEGWELVTMLPTRVGARSRGTGGDPPGTGRRPSRQLTPPSAAANGARGGRQE
jgi:hypothetical protein